MPIDTIIDSPLHVGDVVKARDAAPSEQEKHHGCNTQAAVTPDYMMPKAPKWWHLAQYFHFS